MKRKLPILSAPAVLTVYIEEKKQHEVVIDNITATSWLKVLNINQLPIEKLKEVEFQIEDKNNNVFNKKMLDILFDTTLIDESKPFHIELINNNKTEAIPPFKFVLKSNTIDLSDCKFQISWGTLQQLQKD